VDLPGGLDLVDVLAAGALGPRRELFDLVGPVDLDIDALGLGEDGDGGGGSMDAPLGLGRGDALDGVNAGLEGQFGPDPLAADVDDGGADAAGVGLGGDVEGFEGPALPGGVLLVHLEEVAGPERGLIAAGSGAEF